MDLVTGPFRPALEGAFRERFAQLRRADPLAPIAVIAPSQRLADHLKALALQAVPEGFAAVRFHNLYSFAREIQEAEGPSGTLVLDDLLPERLVRAILRLHFADAPYLSRAAIAPRALVSAIHQMKAGAVQPAKALAAVAEGELGEEEAPKLAELISLLKRYSDELARRRLQEPADVVRRAWELAPKSRFLAGLSHAIYYGFVELDQNQIDLLQRVRARTPTTVFFPWEDAPGYDFAKAFLDTILAPMASTRRVAAGTPRPPRVTQWSTSGARDEVWLAAKEVLRLADSGIPYARIGVVARTLEPYLDVIDPVFREHRIPWISSARRRLAHDPRVKAARLLFSLDDFDRAEVLDLLRSPFLKDREGDRELWDQASRHLGIGHGAEEWRRRLGGAAGKDFVLQIGPRAGGKTFVLPRAEVDRFWSAVEALLEAPAPPAKGWADYADWALERAGRFLEPDARIEAALRSLARLEGLALEEPREALLEALEELSESAGTPGRAGVQVLDAMAARGCSFDALVVLGLNEKVFPRFILPDAFLRDEVRSRFEFRLGNRIPLRSRGYEEERMLFTLLERSADEIVLVYQRSDEKGRVQVDSAYLPLPESRALPRRYSERLAETDFRRLTPVEAALLTGRGAELARAMGRDPAPLERALEFLGQVGSRGRLTPFDGVVDTRTYWPRLASHGISPTALERLAECPFKFFAQGPLGLEELDEPEGESFLTPLEEGEICHDVLERFHRGAGFDQALDEGLRRFEASRSIRYPVLWEVEKERLGQMLHAVVQADDCTEFKPADFEVELKAELPIQAGGRSAVTFRGFADRLDRAKDGSFRVVDYKRSGKKYASTMETGVFKNGKYLQPPLYFLLAQKVTGGPAATSSFVYYFLKEASTGRLWQRELSGEMWERRPDFEGHLRRYLDRIARGEFIIRPGRHCGFCDFRTVCRKSHWPTQVRAADADDPKPAAAEEPA